MARTDTLPHFLTDVADAIRTKTGSSDTIQASTFDTAIANIPSGGGGIEEKDVNFYDYDGTLLYAYTKAEFLALESMPENPTHEGLTANGWNWTLQEMKQYVTDNDICMAGQIYTPTDGKNKFIVKIDNDDLLTLHLGFAINGAATINWGDGSEEETITGASTTTIIQTPHTYTSFGEYTISVASEANINMSGVQVGDYMSPIFGNSRELFALKGAILNKATLGNYAFKACSKMEYIILSPNVSLASSYSGIFMYTGLEALILGNNVSGIQITEAYNLKIISLPSNSIIKGNMSSLPNLKQIIIPKGWVISNNRNDYGSISNTGIEKLVIPKGTEYLGRISQNMFLKDLKIKSNDIFALGETFVGWNYAMNKLSNESDNNLYNSLVGVGTWSLSMPYPIATYKIDTSKLHNIKYLGNNALNRSLEPTTTLNLSTAKTAYIGNGTFGFNNLQSVSLPESLSYIDNNAFQNNDNLTEIYINKASCLQKGNNLPFPKNNGLKIYVPNQWLDYYKNDTNWSTYSDYLYGFAYTYPIEYVGNYGANINTLTKTIPCSVGDHLLAFVATFSYNNTSSSSDWERISNSSSSNGYYMSLYTKTATSSLETITINTTNNTQRFYIMLVNIKDKIANVLNEYKKQGYTNHTDGITITKTTDNDMLVFYQVQNAVSGSGFDNFTSTFAEGDYSLYQFYGASGRLNMVYSGLAKNTSFDIKFNPVKYSFPPNQMSLNSVYVSTLGVELVPPTE